jgi:hypothetical protein
MTNLLLLIALLCILFQGLMFLSLGFFCWIFELKARVCFGLAKIASKVNLKAIAYNLRPLHKYE